MPKEDAFPSLPFPIVPGHEIAEFGEDVNGWTQGQRVGVGWFGGNCGYCEPCRSGDFIDFQTWGSPASPSTVATPTTSW
jgi:D-arabinose 1-dehydrogenase-like Zn-dependent alcohol dehydrogenase